MTNGNEIVGNLIEFCISSVDSDDFPNTKAQSRRYYSDIPSKDLIIE